MSWIGDFEDTSGSRPKTQPEQERSIWKKFDDLLLTIAGGPRNRIAHQFLRIASFGLLFALVSIVALVAWLVLWLGTSDLRLAVGFFAFIILGTIAVVIFAWCVFFAIARGVEPKIIVFSSLIPTFLLFVVFSVITQDNSSSGLTQHDAAAVAATELVERNLRAPSTAEFQNWWEMRVSKTSRGTFIVRGYVDAQNAFGAMLRNDFVAEVSYDGTYWRLEDLEFSGR